MNTAKSIKFNFEQDLKQKLRSLTCDILRGPTFIQDNYVNTKTNI